MRLIDADKLYPDRMTKDGRVAISQNQIANAPTIEVKPKGKWMTKQHVYGVTYCSECDFELKINNTNFCPNCGAMMAKEGNK